jgi:Zn-dependent peptidase ImmA (M78 family)
MHDFRRLPDIGPRQFSPELTLEIRRAQQRRELALEMLAESGGGVPQFTLETTIAADVEAVGKTIRQALRISFAQQTAWKGDVLAAFRAWRLRIEQLGVLVFQATRIERDEASGFAYWADQLPFMVVNQKDAYSRRIFSLLHELAHLMLHQSGVSDLDVDAPRPNDDARVEAFCNRVAAATLMPRDDFLAEHSIAERGSGTHEWPDAVIKALADTYSVSREAIVRRLLTFGRATETFYKGKRAQYGREFRLRLEAQKAQNEGKPIPRNMPRETIASLGRPLVSLILMNYHQDRLTLSEVSGYLGVKTRHLPAIEQQLGFG